MQSHTTPTTVQTNNARGFIVPLVAGIILGVFANAMALLSGASILQALLWHATFGTVGMITIALLLQVLDYIAQWRAPLPNTPSLAG